MLKNIKRYRKIQKTIRKKFRQKKIKVGIQLKKIGYKINK